MFEGLESRRLLASATNLLGNGSIEAGAGGVPTGWTWNCVNGSAPNWTEAQLVQYYGNHNPSFSMGRATSEWVQDSTRAFVGNGALSLTSVAPNEPGRLLETWYGMQPVDGYWLSSSMPATAGTSYMASAWLKRTVQRDEPWLGPLEIRFYNSSGAQISIPFGSVRGGIFSQLPANTWNYAPTTPYLAPTGAVTMRLRFGQEFQADTGGDGTMTADNFAVWALPNTLPTSVRRPDASRLMGNFPNYIHWFRDATASTQPPSVTFPADTTTFTNTWTTVENAVTGNLYYSKTTGATIAVHVTGLLGSLADQRNLTLQITRTNWLGVTEPVINIPAQAVSGFGTTIFSANLTPTNSYGAFHLNVKVMQGSSMVGSTIGRYAVLPALNRPDTAKNIWGVTSGFESPTTALSDVFKNATGTGSDVRTLNGTAGQNLSGTLTPTGDTQTYTVHHQGSTAFNVSLTAKQNAVGGQAGLTLTNNSGQTITATTGGFYTSINIASKLGWTAGSITPEQVKSLVLGFDYLSSGFANPVSAGLYVTHTSPVGGLTEFFASTTLAAAGASTHKAVFLDDLTPANLQIIANFLNANGGNLRVKFAYNGNLNAGAALSAADLSILSVPPKTMENGRLMKVAGFGVGWVRLYDSCDDLGNAAAMATARPLVEWHRHLGMRVVLQIYGSSTFTSPVNYTAVRSAGQAIAREFKDIVDAIGNWGVEQSNHRTPAEPIYRPFDQNGVMMDDLVYDTIASNLYDGMKSIAPNLSVLIGNIATADADNKRADTVLRMYQSPVNGKFDGAILNIYHNQNGMPNVTLEAFDRYGDTQNNIWIEENADSDATLDPTGESVGVKNMVKWRVTQAAKFDGRIEAITQWMFGNGVSPEHVARDMLTQSLQPRPQYVAQAVMTDALSDATYVGDHSTYNTTPPNGAGGWDYATNGIFEWRRSDGSSLWIAYGSGSQTFNVTTASVTVMDMMGNTSTINASGGVVSVPLSSSPVYIFNGGTITHSRPIVPTTLRATSGAGKITLNWAASPGATSYNIYRGVDWSGVTTTTANYPQIATGVTGTTFTDTGRQPGVLYYYRITAVKSGVESGKSNEASTSAVIASTVYMTATDLINTTSFTSGTNWSDTLAPHAGSAYYNYPSDGSTTYYSVRTPGTGASAIFGGDSLHLMGPAGGGSLHLKGPEGQVVTINNLYMENGATINADVATRSYTINGNIIINPGTAPVIGPVAAGKTLTVNSTLSGTGPLTFAGTSNTQATVVTNTNSAFSGDVTVSNLSLSVGGDLSLGVGDIALATNAKLTLAGGATNNYIADGANLNVVTGTTVNLNFAGSDRVGSVTLNGVTYTSGTFGAVGSGAIYTSAIFAGTGILSVPGPAPSAANLQINDGTAQRSKVTSLTVTFDQAVTLASDAFTLLRRSGTSNFALSILNPSGDQKNYVVSFTGADIISNSLADGVYDLTIKASSVVDAYGQTLTGGNRVYTFHRLFGDANGDKTVTNFDYSQFKKTYGLSTGSPSFNASFDYDNSGTITNLDYSQFKKRYGMSLVY